MVTGWLIEDTRSVLHAAALWIVGAKIEPADARQRDRRGAHRAGFERDIEVAAVELLLTEPRRRLAQHQHLGVRGRIALALDPIAGGGDHHVVRPDHHGADRNFTAPRRL